MRKCAFLTMDSLEEFVAYDYLLKEPLGEREWEVSEVPWRKNNVDWSAFDVVIIRTPWDYQDDPDLFLEVLEEIERSPARLENPLELVRWNIDKAYLRELEGQGLPVVPSTWGEIDDLPSETRLNSCFDNFGTEEIVLKPAVSANADNTFRIDREAIRKMMPRLKEIFEGRAWLVQPFVKGITEEGEYSLIYFGDQYSHALLKTPKRGDFRVQEEHGGILKSIEPEPALRTAADGIIAAVDPTPLYSRVDMVRMGDDFYLMELELIEPSLYFNMDPDAPERFARIFERWMSGRTR